MDEALITIDWNLLNNISYRSNLGKSLKNTLRKFDREELFNELDSMITYFTEEATEDTLNYDNRIKSIQSCNLKYEKYYPDVPVEKVFNDILGIRIVIDDYGIFDRINLPKSTKVADMRYGKANDDGYRGIHVYYQRDHFHYPIEVQFVTVNDRQFNEWLHIYTYKYVKDNLVGRKLRQMYDDGRLVTEKQFKEELENVLSNCKEI